MVVLFNAGYLRTLRKKAGLTQAQLAERSELSERQIRQLEGGKVTQPFADTLFRISRILGVNMEDLLELKEEALL